MNEGIHDVHGFLGNTNVWVYLLEDLVDVDGEGLNSSSSGLSSSAIFGFGFSWFFASHYFEQIYLYT